MTQQGQGGWPPVPPEGQPGPWQGSYPPGADGRDPRASFGQPPPQAVHIQSFAPPKASTSTLVTIVAVVVLVLVVVGGLFFRSAQAPAPTPKPTASAAASDAPGQPFTTPDGGAGGRWEIMESRWTDRGVSVHIRVWVDDGPVSFSFRSFPNSGSDVVDPSDGPDRPVLDHGSIAAGKSEDGWVFFATERTDLTVILSTAGGRQMSALVVKG